MNNLDLKCAKPHHHSAPILFICLDPKCKNQRRCCIQCVDKHHIKHDLVSVQKFIREINSNLQKYNDHPEKHQISKLISTIRTEFSKSFVSLKAKIIQTLEKLELKVNDYLATISQVIIANSEQTIKNHIVNTISQTQSVLQDYLNQSIKASKIQLGPFKQIKRKLYDYYYSFEQSSEAFKFELQKMVSTLDKTCSINCLTPKKPNQNFLLSDINKPLSISLQDSKKILQNITAPYNHTVCCLDKPLDYSNNSFCVRIDKNPNKKIWIGVCSLSLVKKNNFFNCFGTGKGTYAIDQTPTSNPFNTTDNFVSVSSHHQLKNQMMGGSQFLPKWNFKEGDILQVRVDILANYVTFYLLNRQFNPQGAYPVNQVYTQYYTMQMKLPTNDIYGFVGLNAIAGDQVTVLSKSQVDKIGEVYGNKWLMFTGELDEQIQDDEDLDW